MKKLILPALALLTIATCAAQEYKYVNIFTTDNAQPISIPIEQFERITFTATAPESGDADNYTLRVLTFEDADYKGDGNYLGFKDWSSLIDTPQYGGPLLYADMASGTAYRWFDQNNTGLCAAINPDDNGKVYWDGGEAISDYIDADYASKVIAYTDQLASPAGGHNGSKNFCVHNGYFDGVFYTEPQGGIWFADGQARVIDHMYVSLSAYGLSAALVGNSFCPKATDTDWVTLTAIGTDSAGNTHQCELPMMRNRQTETGWLKWDLSELGEIVRLDFNITSSFVGDYGMTFPGYFIYDDIAVRFPID